MDSEIKLREKALKIMEEGQLLAASGELNQAKTKFTQSIAICPTSEAYTYWGWILCTEGNINAAISLCLQAIDLDPSLGNPYNDIGCYLVKLKRIEEALEWFQKAKNTARYDSPHYPYLNLARIHLQKKNLQKAIDEYKGVLFFDKSNVEAKFTIEFFDPNFSAQKDRFLSLFSSN